MKAIQVVSKTSSFQELKFGAFLRSFTLTGMDDLTKFNLDNPKYFNLNNLLDIWCHISLNGTLNRGVFKMLIYSGWPWNLNSLPGQATWGASCPRWVVREKNLGFMGIWNKSVSWKTLLLRAPFRDISNKLLNSPRPCASGRVDCT